VIGPFSGGCDLPMRADANPVDCSHPKKPLECGARRALQDTAPTPANLSRAAPDGRGKGRHADLRSEPGAILALKPASRGRGVTTAVVRRSRFR
jgi:hypothetical protein